jgi:hypothetical protein
MFIIQKIIIIQSKKSDFQMKSDSKVVEAKKCFDDITERMYLSKLDDFEFDETTEFSSKAEQGKVNQLQACVLLSVYDVIMEYILLNPKELLSEKVKYIENNFTYYKKLKEDLLKKSKVKGKKGIEIAKYIPTLSFEFTTTIMDLFYPNNDFLNNSEEDTNLDLIAKNMDFRDHILSIIKNQIETVLFN